MVQQERMMWYGEGALVASSFGSLVGLSSRAPSLTDDARCELIGCCDVDTAHRDPRSYDNQQHNEGGPFTYFDDMPIMPKSAGHLQLSQQGVIPSFLAPESPLGTLITNPL